MADWKIMKLTEVVTPEPWCVYNEEDDSFGSDTFHATWEQAMAYAFSEATDELPWEELVIQTLLYYGMIGEADMFAEKWGEGDHD